MLLMACLDDFGFECSYEWKNQVNIRDYHTGCHIYNIAFDTFYFTTPVSFGDIANHVYVSIEECSFYNCINNNNNGAGCICYVAVGGSLVMKKICANKCCLGGGNGQFLSCSIRDSMKVEMNVSTIIHCAHPSMGPGDKIAAIYINEGCVFLYNDNISKCQAYSCAIAKLLSNPNVSLRFIHLSQNMPFTSPAISISSPNVDVSYSNIIANGSPGGHIFYGSSTSFDASFNNCVFYNNFDVLFNFWRKITLDNCIIIHLGLYTSSVVTVLFLNLSTSNSSLYANQISKYSTHRCYDQQYSVNELGEPCQTIPPNPSTCNTLSIQDLKVFDIVSNIFTLFPLVFY